MISEAHYRVHLADLALDVVCGGLGAGEPVQDGEPDQALRLLLQPRHELAAVDAGPRLAAAHAQAAAHAGLDVGAAELRDLAQVARHLHQVVQQQPEAALKYLFSVNIIFCSFLTILFNLKCT